MYAVLKSFLVRLLKTPSEAPEAPSGSHGSVQVFRASPRYLTYRLLVIYLLGAATALAAVLSVLAAALMAEPGILAMAITFAAFIVVLVPAWFVVRIDYDLRYYIVTDRSLRVREGAWVVKEKTLTYANVQNLQIVQGPLQRLFGISNLRVDAAGGGTSKKGPDHRETGHHVTLAGISNAAEVRKLILGYVGRFSRDSGLGDLDERPTATRETGRPAALSGAVLEALRAAQASAAALRRAAEAAPES